MKYFAYGSNMLESRLKDQERCPNASLIGSAVLGGYVLLYNKESKDGSGKCNIVKCASVDSEVFGVLYEIDESEIKILDKKERGYCREPINVKSQGTNNKIEAQTYIAEPHTNGESIVPYDWYKALVIAGALEHKFSEKYICELMQCPSKPDHCRKRHKRELELLDPSVLSMIFDKIQACTREGGKVHDK